MHGPHAPVAGEVQLGEDVVEEAELAGRADELLEAGRREVPLVHQRGVQAHLQGTGGASGVNGRGRGANVSQRRANDTCMPQNGWDAGRLRGVRQVARTGDAALVGVQGGMLAHPEDG